MRRALLSLIGLGLALFASTQAAEAEKRLALVVGIDQYGNLPEDKQLKNAVNDAETLAGTLTKLGFTVDLVRNPRLDEMINRVSTLAEKAEPGDTVLFFFSGHGMSPDSVNLLLPSDFPTITGDSPADRERARRSAYAENEVISAFQSKLVDPESGQQQGLVMFVSDACRDNPFSKALDQGTRSLIRISHGVEAKPVQGVFSIYSAGLGQTALDGLSSTDKNSVFMTEFVKYLPTPDRHLGDLMAEVKEEVATKAQSIMDRSTGKPHVQVPAIYDETVGGRIFLAGRSIAVEAKTPPSPQPAVQTLVTQPPAAQPAATGKSEQAGDLAYLDCVGKDDADCYKQFLRDFPSHAKASQAETLIRAKTELPRYQACVDGASPGERLRLCDLYLDAFPSGKYQNDAKTLRDQALLDLRPVAPMPQAPPQPQPMPQPVPVAPSPPVQPSFSCARASLPVEYAICNSSVLAALDRHLDALYAPRSGSRSVRSGQSAWLNRRNACGSNENCIEQRYREQIAYYSGGGAAAPVQQANPSFPCSKARYPAEIAVCNSALLADLDVQLNRLYLRVKGNKSYAARQRAWVDQRNACGSNAACIEQRYREQIAYLQGAN